MVEAEVTTGVDALLDLLRTTDRIAMSDAATNLKVSLSTLQSWVDFLVEERIVGMEYKFTKPFIYLNKEDTKKVKKEDKIPHLEEIQKDYFNRAKEKKIPQEQIAELWLAHVREEISSLEPFFSEQAQKRGVQNTFEKKSLWNAYAQEIISQIQALEKK